MRTCTAASLGFLSLSAAVAPTVPAAADPIPLFNPYPQLDTKHWYVASGWADGNYESCQWMGNAISVSGNTLRFTLSDKGGKARPYGCAELQSRTHYGYGLYEARMRTAKGSGLNTAFFTYTGSPWDEIDFEFLGKNPTAVQLNYYTGGKGGHEKVINLGFDASASFHTYGFDWQPHYIRWYVDGKQVYQTSSNAALPSHPGLLIFSLWSGAASMNGWLGAFTYTHPVNADFAWVRYTPTTQ